MLCHSNAASDPVVQVGPSDKRVELIISCISNGGGDAAAILFTGMSLIGSRPFNVPSGHSIRLTREQLGDSILSGFTVTALDNSGTLSSVATVIEVSDE